MNVLQNLVALYNQLTPDSTYRNVCSGILEHLEEAASGTIYDIAEITNSSRTTIWRMVQKMGYKSFSDFHYELKRAVKKYAHYNRILPADLCTSSEMIRDTLLGQVSNACDMLKKSVDMKLIEKVADRMFHSDKISFYVAFHSSAIYSLQQNLAVTGVKTAYYSLMPEMLEDSRTLTENSIVFVNTIDHAETMDITDVLENAKKRNATIFGIENGKTKYSHYLDDDLINLGGEQVMIGTAVFDLYFYMLSEIYRMRYIED